MPVGSGESAIYPDLVLASPERRHRLEVVVEVETGESVNSLEALAEWAPLARLHAAFHLYVPAGAVDAARRLCDDHGIVVQENLELSPDRRPDAFHARAPRACREEKAVKAHQAEERQAPGWASGETQAEAEGQERTETCEGGEAACSNDAQRSGSHRRARQITRVACAVRPRHL